MGPRLLRTCLVLGLVVLACGLTVACVAELAPRPDPAPRRAQVGRPAPPSRAVVDPRAVLRDWDERRAAAWVAADPQRLAALYTRGSVAGRRDVRLLRRWTARSLRVTRMEPQVLALTAVRVEPALVVVRVTDRVGVLRAELRGRPVTLPRDQVTSRRVVLRHTDGDAGWRVASVTGLPGAPLRR